MKGRFKLRMAPGETPYTPEQKAQLRELLRDACEAEECFDLDELERFAEAERAKGVM